MSIAFIVGQEVYRYVLKEQHGQNLDESGKRYLVSGVVRDKTAIFQILLVFSFRF